MGLSLRVHSALGHAAQDAALQQKCEVQSNLLPRSCPQESTALVLILHCFQFPGLFTSLYHCGPVISAHLSLSPLIFHLQPSRVTRSLLISFPNKSLCPSPVFTLHTGLHLRTSSLSGHLSHSETSREKFSLPHGLNASPLHTHPCATLGRAQHPRNSLGHQAPWGGAQAPPFSPTMADGQWL